MKRKGYMRTLEAFFAFLITFMFVVFVVLKGVGIKAPRDPLDILPAIEQREDFRHCVYAGNASCVEDLIDPYMPGAFYHKVTIGYPQPFKGAKDIYTETVFIATNQTSDYQVVYLYYWPVAGGYSVSEP